MAILGHHADAIFGVYAPALIVTLLVVGPLSDYVIGRRPVIVGALVVEIGAMSLFLAATGVGWLYATRVLQGCAVGAATSALSAALIDLQPEGSTRAPVVNSFTPGFGLALGALVTSALVQYAPAPTHLIWWLLLGGFALAIPAVLAVPESVARHPGALRSLRPRLGVPRRPMPGPAVALPSDAGTCTGYGRSSGGGELDRELDHHVLLAATSRRRPDFTLTVGTLPARVRGRPTRFAESSDGRAGS